MNMTCFTLHTKDHQNLSKYDELDCITSHFKWRCRNSHTNHR